MKRYTLHYIFQFLGAIFTLLFVACASESQWNDIEFYKVEKQEQLSESPLDDTDEENTEDEDSVEDKFTQLHTGLKREMDVKVDMQFLKSDKDTNERVCQLINAQLIEILLHQSSELSADEAVAQYIDDVKGEFHSDEVADIYRDHGTRRIRHGAGHQLPAGGRSFQRRCSSLHRDHHPEVQHKDGRDDYSRQPLPRYKKGPTERDAFAPAHGEPACPFAG